MLNEGEIGYKKERIELLWLRACKAAAPAQRLHSVYRRFYLKSGNRLWDEHHIGVILTEIVQKYLDIKVSELIDFLSPEHHTANDMEYCERVRLYMTQVVRYTAAEDLPEQVKSARWRNQFLD